MGKLNYYKKIKFSLFDVINLILLSLFLCSLLYPIIYISAVSLSDKLSVLKNEVFIIPKGINFDAYRMIFDHHLFFRSYLNTVIYALLGTLMCLTICVLTSYPLSKNKLKGASFMMMAISFTMLFSGGLIPLYILIRNLHMIDTIWVMIIPGAMSPMYVIIMRTFFKGLPQELEESATIDGANDLQVLAGIVLPLSKPISATIAIFSVVGSWNSYFNPLVFLNNQEKFPLQIILRAITIQNEMSTSGKTVGINGDEKVVTTSVKYAAIMVAVLPMLIIYPFAQKYFVKGMLIGSIKG